MTTTQTSVDNAPRDLEKLLKIGRFNLRVLAQDLGVFASESDKAAFMQASNEQQAETVLRYLQEKDGVSKPAAGKGAATGRTPSTKNAGKAVTATTTTTTSNKPVGTPTAGTGGGEASGVGAGAAAILAAIKNLTETVEGYKATVDNLAIEVQQLQGISAGTNRFVALAIGLSGKLAEQVLESSLEQVLNVVLEDMPAVEAAMQKMSPADEDEEETDEGNEE